MTNAGAGGKTLALAALLGGKGKMLALDSSESKLGESSGGAREAGRGEQMCKPSRSICCSTGRGAARSRRGRASQVLVDAPMLHRPRRHSPQPRGSMEAAPRRSHPAVGHAGCSLARRRSPRRPPAAPLCDLRQCAPSLRREGEDVVEALARREHRVPPLHDRRRDVLGKARTERVATADGRYLRTWGVAAAEGTTVDGFFGAVMRRKKDAGAAS